MLKGYYTIPNGFADSLVEIKSSIINHAWLGLAVFIIPIIFYDIYLFYEGINYALILRASLIFVTFFMALWNKRFTINYRVVSYLIVLYVLILTGFYRFGLYGNASIFIIAYLGIAFFYLRLKGFLFSFVIIVSSYLVITYLFATGLITLRINGDFFSIKSINWLIDLMIVFMISYVFLISVFKVFEAYNKELMNHISSLEKIKYTLDFMPVPLATFNKNREVTMVNREYENYFGYKLQDTPTVRDWLTKIHPDPAERAIVMKEALKEFELFEVFKENTIDYKVLTNDGLTKYVRVYHTVTDNEVICTFLDQTERRRKRQEIIENTLRTEKKEKERIGRELHDGLGPLLTTAKIYVHSLSDEKEVNEEYLKRLDQLLENALNELRMLINNESPHLLQQYGLEKAIRSFLQNVAVISTINVSLEATTLKFKKDIVEFALYRAILELINNTLKYAEATELKIKIEQEGDLITVIYSDNGKGFDYNIGITKGNGLINIQNRISNVGGTISYITAPDKGVEVTIQMLETQEV